MSESSLAPSPSCPTLTPPPSLHPPRPAPATSQLAFGEGLKLVGSVPKLGAWNSGQGAVMRWTEGDKWVADMEVPVGVDVSFKVSLEENTPTPSQHPWENMFVWFRSCFRCADAWGERVGADGWVELEVTWTTLRACVSDGMSCIAVALPSPDSAFSRILSLHLRVCRSCG